MISPVSSITPVCVPPVMTQASVSRAALVSLSARHNVLWEKERWDLMQKEKMGGVNEHEEKAYKWSIRQASMQLD